MNKKLIRRTFRQRAIIDKLTRVLRPQTTSCAAPARQRPDRESS